MSITRSGSSFDRENNNRLTATIDAIARGHMTPRFDPHVTLLTQIKLNEDEAIARSEDLGRQTAPFTIKLTELRVGNSYFFCVFHGSNRVHTS